MYLRCWRMKSVYVSHAVRKSESLPADKRFHHAPRDPRPQRVRITVERGAIHKTWIDVNETDLAGEFICKLFEEESLRERGVIAHFCHAIDIWFWSTDWGFAGLDVVFYGASKYGDDVCGVGRCGEQAAEAVNEAHT
jgi:hypothetical protein